MVTSETGSLYSYGALSPIWMSKSDRLIVSLLEHCWPMTLAGNPRWRHEFALEKTNDWGHSGTTKTFSFNGWKEHPSTDLYTGHLEKYLQQIISFSGGDGGGNGGDGGWRMTPWSSWATCRINLLISSRWCSHNCHHYIPPRPQRAENNEDV